MSSEQSREEIAALQLQVQQLLGRVASLEQRQTNVENQVGSSSGNGGIGAPQPLRSDTGTGLSSGSLVNMDRSVTGGSSSVLSDLGPLSKKIQGRPPTPPLKAHGEVPEQEEEEGERMSPSNTTSNVAANFLDILPDDTVRSPPAGGAKGAPAIKLEQPSQSIPEEDALAPPGSLSSFFTTLEARMSEELGAWRARAERGEARKASAQSEFRETLREWQQAQQPPDVHPIPAAVAIPPQGGENSAVPAELFSPSTEASETPKGKASPIPLLNGERVGVEQNRTAQDEEEELLPPDAGLEGSEVKDPRQEDEEAPAAKRQRREPADNHPRVVPPTPLPDGTKKFSLKRCLAQYSPGPGGTTSADSRPRLGQLTQPPVDGTVRGVPAFAVDTESPTSSLTQ